MFNMLLECQPRHRASRWGIVAALLLHGGILGALLRHPAQAAAPVFILPSDSFPAPVEAVRRHSTGLVRFPFRVPQPVIPTLPAPGPIPGVPELPRPTVGVPATPVPSVDDSTALPWGAPWPSTLVEEAPALLAAPLPAYPPRLRDAGIQGQVIVEAVVDTLGRVEPGSIRIVRSDHAGLEAPAAASIAAALFRPARVYGRAVRVRVQVPLSFRLR
jgi:protein TonB